MIPYASHTNGSRNLAELGKYGWRLLRTPFTTGQSNHGFRYALDNGAWSAHQQGTEFDSAAFERCMRDYAAGADWIAVPDIVCGGLDSLAFSLSWLGRVKRHGRVALIPVQDGMQDEHIEPLVGPGTGIFIGGSTDFKERSAPRWGRLASRARCYLHVGRVNTCRRIAICGAAGADSFDGTSATRFSKNVQMLTQANDKATRQLDMFSPRVIPV